MGFVEGMKVISEPLTKLIEAVSKAIGKAYEPRYVRKLADAKAYQIERISEAVRNNCDLPIVYNGDQASINTNDYDELRRRAGARLAYQEMRKQENIESIVDRACVELDGKETVSDDKISPEWMNRYINMAGDISTEEMQHIWAKVLAGEVVKSGSFSMKTLECLRNMSVKDAELFAKVASFVVSDCTVFNDNDINTKYGIRYADILTLDDCGLINSSSTINIKAHISNTPCPIIDFGEYCLVVSAEKEMDVSFPNYPLTRAGMELLSIARNEPMDKQYIIDVCKLMKKRNSNASFSIHKILLRTEEGISIEDEEASI